ncbi:biliverdin-producing heme oxygenase [Glaciecola sp. 1036]|uniref:biliverdin-producing heme oxygenase n=1 Tax=Alteromonadaceae TaxID=72275 RepID=UPI003CFDA50E
MAELLSSNKNGIEPSDDICLRLRQDTSAEHNKIESLMSTFLFSKHFKLTDYFNMLQIKRDYYAAVESQVSQFPTMLQMVNNSEKTKWLDADLAYVQNNYEVRQTTPTLDISCITLLPQTPAEAMGFIYVFEGATLGGMHIIPKLRVHGYFPQDQGLRFFASYGKNTPARWRRFQTELRAFAHFTPSASEEIIKGAKASFSNMYMLLKDICHA